MTPMGFTQSDTLPATTLSDILDGLAGYNGSKASDARRFQRDHGKTIYELVSGTSELDTRIHESVLRRAGWYNRRSMWFSPRFAISNHNEALLIYKLAVLEQCEPDGMPIAPGSPKGNKMLSRLIYMAGKSKQNASLKIQPGTVDRCDQFKAQINNTNTDNQAIRFNGTSEGCAVASKESSDRYSDFNMEFIRVLQNGPAGIDAPVCCNYTGTPIGATHKFSQSEQRMVKSHTIEYHHALFKQGASWYYDPETKLHAKKNIEPSTYTTNSKYTDWDTTRVSEVLGIIVLSPDGHSTIHKIEKRDGINFWINRLNRKDVSNVPAHWKSAENYNNLIAWIKTRCANVDISKLLSYDEFIKVHLA